ncbi:MAG: glycosyltransferase [Holosporaceae bacterium]|nr:glycosyltransferase [Holosporaceae bacterium]
MIVFARVLADFSRLKRQKIWRVHILLALAVCGVTMAEPDVSVIIPVYNTPERFLKECLDSLINQTLKDIEIICVDDGSTDQCVWRVLQEYAQKDRRIKVIKHCQNAGIAAARNTGLAAARGKYFAFLDSDDYMHPDMLQILHTEIMRGDFDVAACNFCRPEENTNVEFPKISQYETKEILQAEELLFFGLVWNKLFRSASFKGKKFDPDLSGCDDSYFILCVYPLIRGSINVYATLYYWRKNANSESMKPISKEFAERAEKTIKKVIRLSISDDVKYAATSTIFAWLINGIRSEKVIELSVVLHALRIINMAYFNRLIMSKTSYFWYLGIQAYLIKTFLKNQLKRQVKKIQKKMGML